MNAVIDISWITYLKEDTAYFQLLWVEKDNFSLVSVNLVSVSDNVGRSEIIVSFNVG